MARAWQSAGPSRKEYRCDTGRIWDKEQETITLETCDLKGAGRTVVMSDVSARAFRLLPPGTPDLRSGRGSSELH
jgi:hypothetical protein